LGDTEHEDPVVARRCIANPLVRSGPPASFHVEAFHGHLMGIDLSGQKNMSEGNNQMADVQTLNSIRVNASNNPLSIEEQRKMHAYWRAANYLSVGQIYLFANPLLREPLKIDHVKPRLLGHWGTTPGLNFIYVHFNRLIRKLGLNCIYIAGPGHGGPGLVANTYLEGSYTEFYPNITQDEEGMRRLFKQFK